MSKSTRHCRLHHALNRAKLTPFRRVLALSLGISITGALPFGSPTARAATEYWDTGTAATTINGQTSGTWNTTLTNWESAATKIVWTNTNVAAFSTNGATVSSTVNTNAGTSDATIDSIVVTLGVSGLSASQLFFNNTGFIISAATAQTLTVSNTGTSSIIVANGKTASIGSNATINLVSTNIAASNTVAVGGAAGGVFNVETGGTLSYFSGTTGGAGQFSFRTNADAVGESGTINVTGTVSFAATTPTSQIGLGQTNGAVTMNVNNGGLVTSASTGAANSLGSLLLSNNGAAAILNVNTGGAVTLSGTASTAGLNVARGAGSTGAGTGTVNLNGGTITTARLFSGTVLASNTTATSTFNFNGGTLAADVSTTNFMAGLTRANVRDGGAIIDTGVFNVTAAQALVHSNVTGNNPNTGAADSATDGGLTKKGTGTLTLNGVNTYTGPTAITNGTLALGNSGSLAGTAITAGSTANSTTGTLQINGNYTIGTSGSASLTLANTYGAVSLQDTTVNTLTINNATAGATALTISGGNSLSFDAGASSSDLITLGSGLGASVSGSNTVNINILARPSGTQTLTLINAPNGGLTGGTFMLGTISGAVTSASSFGLTLSLNQTSTQLQLLETATAAPATAYFTGSLGASWTANNGTTGNFSTDSAGTTGVTQLPGAATDVHFYATNANTTNVAASTLDSAFTIRTLTVDGSTLGESAPVGIAPGTGGSLTITPTDSSTGITVNSGAGAVTISAPLTLGAAQTWTNNSASLLTVSGTVTNNANALTLAGSGNTTISGVYGSGAGSLTMSGAGTLTLSNTNTYTGGNTLNSGIVSIAANLNLGTAASGVAFNGGTLQTTNTTVLTDTHVLTVNSGGGTLNITGNGTAGSSQFYLATTNTLVGSGPLTITGNGTLTSTGAGNLRTGATQTYSGAITVQSGGSFEYGVTNAVGSTATVAIGNEGELITNSGVTDPLNSTVTGGTNSYLSFENGNAGIYSGAITLNGNLTVGLRDWYNYATVRSGTISGVISGSGGLTTNPGTATAGNPVLTLTNADTYAGATTIAANTTLQLGSAGTAGTIANSSSVVDNGTFTISRTNAVVQGTDFPNAVSGTGALVETAGTLSLGTGNTYGGMTSVNTGGVLTISSFNHFASGSIGGGTTTTTPAASSSLGVPSSALNNVLNLGGGGLGGTVIYTGTGEVTDKSINLGGGSGTPNGTLDQSGTGALVFTGNVTAAGVAKTLILQGSTAGTGEIDGVISNVSSTVLVSLTKQGTGTWTLGGTNTYTGATTISAGTLQLGNGTSGNDGTIAGTSGVADAGTLAFNRFGASTANYVISGGGLITVSGGGSQTLLGANTFTGAITINSGATLQLGDGTSGHDGTVGMASSVTDNGTLIYNRFGSTLSAAYAISGTGGLTKLGAGSQSLMGTNTYTGTTTVGGGTLLLASTGSINGSPTVNVNVGALTLQTATGLSDSGTLSLASGTALNLDEASGTTTETISSLIINGTVEPAGTYTAAQLTSLENPGDNVTFESGFGETLTIAPVPEPATWLAGVLILGTFGYRGRRHLGSLTRRIARVA